MEDNNQVVQSSHMPRAVLTDENDVPKKATRKRVANADENEGVVVPRKRAPRVRKALAADDFSVDSAATAPVRKAPTPIASEQEKKVAGQKRLLITLSVVIFGFVSSAVVGFSDPGKIDINQVIAQRNQQLTSDGQTDVMTIPVQNTSQEPDGGLIGRENQPQTPAVVEEAATTTASSTQEVSSTTPQAQVPLTDEEAQANIEAAAATQ